MVADGTGAFSGSIGPDRRSFLKRLVGTAFAAPVVASFTMSGIEAVFGAPTKALAGAPNSSPAKRADYTTPIGCLTYSPNLATSATFPDGGRSVLLSVPNVAFTEPTVVCVYRGSLIMLANQVPSGETPVSAYGVVWTGVQSGRRFNSINPLSIDVTDPDVQSGDPIYSLDTGSPVNEGTASDGQWGDSFNVDPHYVVTHVEETPPPADGGSGGGTAGSGATAADAVVTQPETTG